MTTKIIRAGGVLAVCLPEEILKSQGLAEGSEVEIYESPFNGTIVVEKSSEKLRFAVDTMIENRDKGLNTGDFSLLNHLNTTRRPDEGEEW